MILAATSEGVHRVERSGAVESVLTDTTVRQLRAADRTVFAASDDGLSRTVDGSTWESLPVPEPDVFSVLATESRLYAGVRPAGILVSDDDGKTWDRLAGFDDLAAASAWPTSPHYDQAWVRTLAVVPAGESAVQASSTGRLLAGVEVGGLVRSDDGGQHWATVPAVPDDVHHVLPITAQRWIVSCGTGGPDGEGGVFETTDGGEHWRRRETDPYCYARESCYGGRVYTAANETAPLWDPPEAALFVERAGGLDPVSYPGEPTSLVVSWTIADGTVVAGTNDGRLLRESDDGWREFATIPVGDDDRRTYGIRSLASVTAGTGQTT